MANTTPLTPQILANASCQVEKTDMNVANWPATDASKIIGYIDEGNWGFYTIIYTDGSVG